MDNIQILGFRANIDSVGEVLGKINSIKDDGEIIQLLNADSVVSKNHIIHGVNQAFLAFERGENLANDLSVEIVLRCSAQRQIWDDDVLIPDEDKLIEMYKISDDELQNMSVEEIIIDRITKLTVDM